MFDLLTPASVFVLLLLARVPVGFCLAIAASVGMMRSMPAEPALVTVAQRMATSLDSFTLLAIPLFILAGQIMSRGGIARRLIDFAASLLRGLPGGLAHVHILASMLFGAISGSAVATATAVGGVMAPRMEEEGYERNFGAAVNISSATTGLVIPPSNILIVYSLASGGTSIAALFVAGYLPGIAVGLALMAVAAVSSRRWGPATTAATNAPVTLSRSLLDALPSLGLPVVVVGGIIGGAFTATEASAVAVLYASALALVYGELKLGHLPEILRDSATTTGTVMLLIASSMALSWLLAYERLPQEASEALLGLSDEPAVVLLLMNVTLLAVGTFMDMTPAVLIFTPIFLPVAMDLGVDPVHFGIVMILNLCIGLCTPPVGTVLFVGCGVARTQITGVVRPLLPMFLAMIAVLALVTALPWLSLGLPGAFGLLD